MDKMNKKNQDFLLQIILNFLFIALRVRQCILLQSEKSKIKPLKSPQFRAAVSRENLSAKPFQCPQDRMKGQVWMRMGLYGYTKTWVDQAWQKELRIQGDGTRMRKLGVTGRRLRQGSTGWARQSTRGRRAPSSDANPFSSIRIESSAPWPCSPAHKGFPKGKAPLQGGSVNTVPSLSADVYHFGFLALPCYRRVRLQQGRAASIPSPPKALGPQPAHLSQRWSKESCKTQCCKTRSYKSQAHIMVMPTRQGKARK